MAARKKSAAKKKGYNNHFWSIIMFSLGILVAMLTFIEGSALWKIIHNVLLGLFGVSVFLIAPIMIYASIMIALDKSHSTVVAKIIQGSILILLFSATVQITFIGKVTGDGFFDKLKNLYTDGTYLKGGGFFSALLGWPLLTLFHKVGATIIVILLIRITSYNVCYTKLLRFF